MTEFGQFPYFCPRRFKHEDEDKMIIAVHDYYMCRQFNFRSVFFPTAERNWIQFQRLFTW